MRKFPFTDFTQLEVAQNTQHNQPWEPAAPSPQQSFEPLFTDDNTPAIFHDDAISNLNNSETYRDDVSYAQDEESNIEHAENLAKKANHYSLSQQSGPNPQSQVAKDDTVQSAAPTTSNQDIVPSTDSDNAMPSLETQQDNAWTERTLEAILGQLSRVHKLPEDIVNKCTSEYITLALAIAGKIIDKLYHYCPEEIVKDFIATKDLSELPAVQIEVNDKIYQAIHDYLSAASLNQATVIANGNIAPGDCVISWGNGKWLKDKEQQLQRIEGILQHYLTP